MENTLGYLRGFFREKFKRTNLNFSKIRPIKKKIEKNFFMNKSSFRVYWEVLMTVRSSFE